MTTGIYSGVQSMAASQQQLDSLAHNLANSSTTAYKRETSFVNAMAVANRGGKEEQLRVGSRIDFSQGALDMTGNPLNLALEGQGFFAVEGERGEVYTRNGQFQVDAEGILKSLDGLPVAWDVLQGAIDSEGDPIVVNSEGTVSQNGREIGRLRLVDFEDDQQLQTIDGGYYSAPLSLKEAAHSVSVVQGSLEGSNVNPIEEMVAMISVQRRFSGAANLLGMINETYKRLSRLQ